MIFLFCSYMCAIWTRKLNRCLHFQIQAWIVVSSINPQNCNNAVWNTLYLMQGMYHEFRGHCVFGSKKLQKHTWPFQLQRQSWAGLMEVTFPHALSIMPGRARSVLCTSRAGGGVEEGGGLELMLACLHLQNKERGWRMDYSGYFFTVEG